MPRVGEAGAQPPEGAENRDPMMMTDAALRAWLRDPQWRAQLHRLLAEEALGSRAVVAGWGAEVALATPSSPARVDPAAGTPAAASSGGIVPPEDGLSELLQVEDSEAVWEEDLVDYELEATRKIGVGTYGGLAEKLRARWERVVHWGRGDNPGQSTRVRNAG